ncbi:MAG: LTA synthase family protein [Bacilli bacterium]|nr:LTA synthase family protein [Bacilli bacterium]
MNKYIKPIVFTLYIFILNIVFSLLMFKHIYFSSILFYFFEAVTVSLILSIISNLFKGKANKIVSIILFSIITFLFIAQYVHYHFYDCFFSIFSLVNGGQVLAFIPAIVKIIITNILGFLLLFVFLAFIIGYIVKSKSDVKPKNSILLTLLIISLIITNLCIFIPKSGNVYSRKNLLNVTNSETKNVQSFGLITSMAIDLERFIFSPNYSLIDENSNVDSYSMEKYNVLNIDFDSIKTDDIEINSLNNYLRNRKPTNKNEYTGIFKGKNLIFITAESFSFSVIDKKLTPTLYKMTNEGFNFSNFYTPIYYASTSDGEYTNLTGLLPKEGTWSYIATKYNYFPYTYSNAFKDKNYSLNGYHNGAYKFYDRDEVMPNLGYNYKSCGNGLEKLIDCSLWPESDEEMITETFKDYGNKDKFVTYYISISGHLNHNFKDNDMAIKHQDEVKDLKYSDSIKAYIAANMDLDKALEHLIDNLKKANKLNDTVIVLAPDHFPYGLSHKEYSELRTINTIYDKHKSNVIIYNPSVKGKTIDKYASNIDILPTILNMFGVSYDSRLLIGSDIMSDSEGIVIFNDRSFLTEYGFYDERVSKFTSFKKVPDNYIKDKQKEVLNKYNASGLILEKNYYEKIKAN